jgi:hypothetical protein
VKRHDDQDDVLPPENVMNSNFLVLKDGKHDIWEQKRRHLVDSSVKQLRDRKYRFFLISAIDETLTSHVLSTH